MAFAAADYAKLWTSQLVVNLRQRTLMMQLLTQRGTAPWVMGANQVNIPSPTRTSVAATMAARDADWETASEWAQTNIQFDTEDRFQESNIVKYEDMVEIPWDTVAETRDEQDYKVRLKIDDDTYDTVKAGIATGDQTTLGSAGTNYISRDAPYTPNGTGAGLVADSLDMFSIKAARANQYGEGDSAGQLWCVIPPELFKVARRNLLDKGLSLDELTRQTLGTSFGTSADYQGRYAGIDIYSANYEAVPTGSDNWVYICGMTEAAAMNVRTPLVQNFPPDVNPTSQPGHLLRQRGFYGFAELDGGLLHQFTIHAD